MLSDQRMQRISTALSEQGFSVDLYYRDYFKYTSRQKPEMPAVKGIRTFALRPWVSMGIGFYVNYNLLLLLKLLFKHTDMWYAVDTDTIPALAILSILRRKPLIYDAHEYFAEVPELKNKPIKKAIWHACTAFACKQAAVRITVSESLAEALEKRYGKPFECIRNVPVLNRQSFPASPMDKPVILYQGALNRGRKLETLIRAMQHLPEFRCIIAGEGDLSRELRAMAAGATNIEFKGLLTPDELKTLTPKCFAGYNLLDAEDSLSYRYSLSNKYFDYMHAGVPSISSTLPEYLKLNERWKCGVCIGDKENELIQLLQGWKNNPSEYLMLRENAKFAADSENWDTEKLKLGTLLKF